jgi:hypothetical protein
MKRKVTQHLSAIDSLRNALNQLEIKWLDLDEFVEKRRRYEWTHNEKKNKLQFRFQDITTKVIYDGNLKNIHRSLVNHAMIGYYYENYNRFNTRCLINCMETEIYNFYFKECKPPIEDGVARFFIKSIADIQFTSKRKHDILLAGTSLCSCGKIGSIKHIISCCPHRAGHMTKRNDNIGRILVQAIKANNRKKLVKSTNGEYIHWNQELMVPDEILNPRKFPSVFEREESIRRPDI